MRRMFSKNELEKMIQERGGTKLYIHNYYISNDDYAISIVFVSDMNRVFKLGDDTITLNILSLMSCVEENTGYAFLRLEELTFDEDKVAVIGVAFDTNGFIGYTNITLNSPEIEAEIIPL